MNPRPARRPSQFVRLRLELLEDRRMLSVDFGDAPDPYPTTLADDGARHEAIGPTLGAARDAELDGQPTTDGDGADEYGVTFGSVRVGQLDAMVNVNVGSAPAGAKLDAWIDFNGDGTWGGPWEKIASSLAVIEGGNSIDFAVPVGAISGATYARFRISTAGNLGPAGLANDGEVEDYLVNIRSPLSGSGVLNLIALPTKRKIPIRSMRRTWTATATWTC